MWMLVIYDLPVETKIQRRAAHTFHDMLVDLGFSMMQFSVYTQYLPYSARAVSILKEIKAGLPTDGDVTIMYLTDKQWSSAVRYSNSTEISKTRMKKNEIADGEQLTLF